MSGYDTVQCTQLGTSLVDSLAWQTHLPDTTADDTSLFPMQYQRSTGGSYAETQTNIWLASYLVIAPNSSSGGLELYKEEDLWGTVFYT